MEKIVTIYNGIDRVWFSRKKALDHFRQILDRLEPDSDEYDRCIRVIGKLSVGRTVVKDKD